jgi:hypothetical protein
MQNEINDDLTSNINDYIDTILNNYIDLGTKPCVSLLKYEKNSNNLYVMLMYSANELQECKNMKKHKKGCQCRNIIYVSMILDANLNLINTNDKSLYINDLYSIVFNVLKKFYL